MRIMYLLDSMKFGGAEMLLLAMVRRYATDHQITVVYFTHGPLYEDFVKEGVKVIRISERGWKDPLLFPRLMRLMRAEKPDVVHTHLSKSDFFGLMAAWLTGVPARLSSIHNVDPWRKNAVFSAFMRIWTATAQHHIAVSQSVRDYTLKHTHYEQEGDDELDKGVDLGRFLPAADTPLA
ncbi:MAG: glycosyltransferase, partial [Armatimonadetes bacterium]|nr:glycosyltransferase [Anaerolineae bacterium]